MRTVMYLVRHGATAANLMKPARLQGRNDVPLDPVGIRQAEATGVALAGVSLAASYSSPLLRAMQTAALIAPQLRPQLVNQLIECNVGRWEGVDWDTIHRDFAVEFANYMADPASVGYPDGENFQEVADRIGPAFADIFARHVGQTFLVISHHVVNRVYLAQALGLPLRLGRNVMLDNCGVSIVEHDGKKLRVVTVNSTLHLGCANQAS